jgi:hypothetical protein
MPTLITVNDRKPGTSWLLLVMGKNSGGSRYSGDPPDSDIHRSQLVECVKQLVSFEESSSVQQVDSSSS